MRLLACLLIGLIPTVTSAQAVASASSPALPAQEAQSVEGLEVLPIVADEDLGPLFWGGVAAFTVGLVVLYMVLSGDSLGDLGNSLLAIGGTIVVCGAFGLCMKGGTDMTEAPDETYDVDALVAYAADDLTAEHRQALAEVARERGREGIVLQRLVETRAGVGDAPGAYALEVSVVDAETAQLRPVGEDLLGAWSVLSIPLADLDLEAAQAEVLDQLLHDA